VVGPAGSGPAGASTAERVEEHRPDVVLAELGRGDAPADAVAAAVRGGADAGAAPAVVLLGAAGGERTLAADALRAGARGVLPAAATGGEIVAAVEAAAAGVAVVHPDLVASLVGAPVLAARAAAAAAPAQALTPRELQVLGLLAEGLGNKQIAGRLRISEHTVKFHVAAVFEKLGAGTRAEAVAIGARRGVVML
jgi:DNA-binding NarL/FixJ family response regulator